MKVTELRIGNFIQSGNNGVYDEDGTKGKILSINQEECEFEQIYCECEESFDWFFKDNYFGIPLTEEWLIMFGFKLTEAATGTFNRIWFLNGHAVADGSFYFHGEELGIPVEYVHQLQNLYFALTEEELTI